MTTRIPGMFDSAGLDDSVSSLVDLMDILGATKAPPRPPKTTPKNPEPEPAGHDFEAMMRAAPSRPLDPAPTPEATPGPAQPKPASYAVYRSNAPDSRTLAPSLAPASGGTDAKRLQDFILATSDWIWETDENAVLTFVSERLTEVLGRPSRDLKGSYLFDLGQTPIDSRGDSQGNSQGESLAEAFVARRPFRQVPFEIAGADGRTRRCALSGVPVFDDATGAFRGYRGAGADVTARVEAEATARRYRQKLEHALEEIKNKNMYLEIALTDATAATRAKADFLAIVSHELRTPLNAVIGFTDIMRREMFGPIGNKRYAEYLNNIGDSAEHLLGIISDILDMSKIESGKLDLQDSEIDVVKTVEACWKLVAERAAEHGVDFATILPADLPRLIADERIVKQMLINLFSNGIKFTPKHGSITVGAGMLADGGLAIRVSDTGIGIAAEDFETVLRPFGQVENAYSRTREGTGLGLPLVKSMIELHGGSLELESTLGAGTTITLTFPPERVVRPASD